MPNKVKDHIMILAMSVMLSGCHHQTSPFTITESLFGSTKEGKNVTEYKLTNSSGMTVRIINYGATITSIMVPDKDGIQGDVVLGYDNIRGYEEGDEYFGCVVGRYANRIAGGSFMLSGKEYKLARNNGPNSLHGGRKGFNSKIWKTETFISRDSVGLIMTYLSKDGEEGYPGNLMCKLIYSLNNSNELVMSYEAETDALTVLNLCNHSYFNLKDGGASSALEHELMIPASHYTPVDSTMIPTGELPPLAGTPFDFRVATEIGKRINDDHIQLKYGIGYDHNYVLDKEPGELALAAKLSEEISGRILEILTTEPGIQFYSGNFLKGERTGKDGIKYNQRSGIALETQHFPDSPNQPDFPPVVLHPDEKFNSTTIFKFRIEQ